MERSCPTVYCFPTYRTAIYETNSNKEVIAGCSPWMYLLPNEESGFRLRNGTVAFPPHSSHHVESRLSDEKLYLEKLRALPSCMQPIRICMYWRDIQLGRHNAYLTSGFPVVTAGHIFDELFFDRLFRIMDGAEYLHTPVVGSHIFYGAANGLKIILDRSLETSIVADRVILARDTSKPEVNFLEEVFSVYETLDDVARQKAVAVEMLGGRNRQSPRQLRGLFLRLYFKDGRMARSLIKMTWKYIRAQIGAHFRCWGLRINRSNNDA